MRAVDKADADERGFRAENICINAVERIAAVVVVAVAGRAGEQVVRNAVLHEGGEHLFGVAVADFLDAGKIRTDLALCFQTERTNIFRNL